MTTYSQKTTEFPGDGGIISHLQVWLCRLTGRHFQYQIRISYYAPWGAELWTQTRWMGFSHPLSLRPTKHRRIKKHLFGKGIKSNPWLSHAPVCNGRLEITSVSYLGWY